MYRVDYHDGAFKELPMSPFGYCLLSFGFCFALLFIAFFACVILPWFFSLITGQKESPPLWPAPADCAGAAPPPAEPSKI
jgi:hypothetical protein